MLRAKKDYEAKLGITIDYEIIGPALEDDAEGYIRSLENAISQNPDAILTAVNGQNPEAQKEVNVPPVIVTGANIDSEEIQFMMRPYIKDESQEMEENRSTEAPKTTEAPSATDPIFQIRNIYHSTTGDGNIWSDISYWWEEIDGAIFVYIEPMIDIEYLVNAYPSLWTGSISVGKRDGSYPLEYSWYGGEEANWDRDLYTIVLDKNTPAGEYVWRVDEYENGTGAHISTLEVVFVLDNDNV